SACERSDFVTASAVAPGCAHFALCLRLPCITVYHGRSRVLCLCHAQCLWATLGADCAVRPVCDDSQRTRTHAWNRDSMEYAVYLFRDCFLPALYPASTSLYLFK